MNERPIIGILAQETEGNFKELGESFIYSTYVKFAESSGAQVVPIKICQTEEYYKEIFHRINGLIMPGGVVSIQNSKYTEAAKILINLAIQANDKNDYFPIFGICLGFQVLLQYFSSDNIMDRCSNSNVKSGLRLEQGYEESKLFGSLDKNMKEIFETEDVLINFHYDCITPKDFFANKLDASFRILSRNYDINKFEFISCYEARSYPFYGVQFHPEKNPFFWVLNEKVSNIPHTKNAIKASQYFSNFFVNEARKSYHKFEDLETEKKALDLQL
ncbi:Gamma-glutamyl hydrolase [Nymphon striatum]|nr:Gamma-glutamyl hydrolase [Nymphon striatum]